MHTAEAARGRGIARALYQGAGFSPCEPFGSYRRSPHGVYLTIDLDV